MSDNACRALLYVVIVALAGIVLCVALAAAASAQPCEDPDPCGGEPALLPQLWLPAVLQRTPPMAAEYDPAQPVATPEPDPPVIGD